MQLNRFTDLGIRVLLLLGSNLAEKLTISELAQTLQVSKNHLMKVVHFLSKQEWLITVRGKNGGVKLAFSLEKYALGHTIKVLEMHASHDKKLINCHEPSCILLPSCMLEGFLEDALQKFYEQLDCYTLQDIVKNPISKTIRIPIQLA